MSKIKFEGVMKSVELNGIYWPGIDTTYWHCQNLFDCTWLKSHHYIDTSVVATFYLLIKYFVFFF